MTVRLHPIALFLASLLPLSASAEVQLDTPRAGWRQGSDEGAHFIQEVNYPASSVNVAADQAETARIRGLIKGVAKVAEKPARLVVNGISMPLKVQEDGRFDRPFVFPSGSNNVEVRSPDGQQTRRVQFYNQGSGETPAKLRVALSWDSDNTDLDLHLVTPDGGHVWYGERSLANGAAQDVDVTTGYGPEMIASPTPLKGQYLVYVNYFGGGYGDDGNAAVALTTAQITLITEEGTPNEKQESFLVPMRAPGELTLVKRFSYP
ncbi:YfaP family protein [Aquipseudomonas ullengensis]|uniref:YfaP family protein n=1 Tax=Aquipseudomonas ullengensis TaxID=2759166 RepID=UPI0038B2663B